MLLLSAKCKGTTYWADVWRRNKPSVKLAYNRCQFYASSKKEYAELRVLLGNAGIFYCLRNTKSCAPLATAGTLTAAQRGSAPFFIITCRNFTTTLELGRISTWRLPRFSALYMLFRASPSTLIRTMLRRRLKRAGLPGLLLLRCLGFPTHLGGSRACYPAPLHETLLDDVPSLLHLPGRARPCRPVCFPVLIKRSAAKGPAFCEG